jgi:hypothetical protein
MRVTIHEFADHLPMKIVMAGDGNERSEVAVDEKTPVGQRGTASEAAEMREDVMKAGEEIVAEKEEEVLGGLDDAVHDELVMEQHDYEMAAGIEMHEMHERLARRFALQKKKNH